MDKTKTKENKSKNKVQLYVAYKRPSSDVRAQRLKVKGWEKKIYENENKKKCGVAILISDKVDVKIETVIKDNEEHCIILKKSIQQEGITIVNIYVPNIGVPQYIRQILTEIKGETITVWDFNTQLTSMDRSSR